MKFGYNTLAFLLVSATNAVAGSATKLLLAQRFQQDRDFVRPGDRPREMDDDDYQWPAWGQMGQTLNLMDEETLEATGWNVAMSKDGQTLVQAYPITDKLFNTVGFKIVPYTHASRLLNWIPYGDPVRLETPTISIESAAAITNLAMTTDLLAFGYAVDGDVTDPRVVSESGQVHVLQLFVAGTSGRAWESSWIPSAKPIENKSPDKRKEMFGASVALSDGFDDTNILVAVGTMPFNPTSPGRVEVYTLNSMDPTQSKEWELVGKPIVGDKDTFGASVKFSLDGTVLAVLSSFPDDNGNNDDDNMNFTCLILVFHFSKQAQDWVQMGQNITANDKDDSLNCLNVALSSDGTTLVSGPRQRFDKESPVAGHVRVWSFSEASQSWERKGEDLDTLVPNASLDVGQVFGAAVAISDDGNRVAVSTSEGDVLNFLNFGSIHSFEWKGDRWNLVGGPVTTDGTAISMAMVNEGNTLAYGSPFGLSGHGSVSVLDWRGDENDDSFESVIEEEG